VIAFIVVVCHVGGIVLIAVGAVSVLKRIFRLADRYFRRRHALQDAARAALAQAHDDEILRIVADRHMAIDRHPAGAKRRRRAAPPKIPADLAAAVADIDVDGIASLYLPPKES
jgi:hypothetical protein